jgi:APA family basic amino acid/polyamine antiporter
MALLVMDPGITAALGIGLAQYFVAAIGGPTDRVPAIAIASIAVFGALALMGINASARVMAWTAAAKLGIVALLVGTAVVRAGTSGVDLQTDAMPSTRALAASLVAAFFAFGGWWEFGRMAEDVESPRRTMPRALIGGIALVTAIYALASVAYTLAAPHAAPATDEAFVAVIGANLFGTAARSLLAIVVVVAVSGSLAATLLGAPRLYVAMARDGLFPPRLARVDARRGSVPASTLVQIVLASCLVLIGTFNDILGYFIPSVVFFLGLSAAAILVLPRPAPRADVFEAPLHPAPIALFLALVVVVLAVFAIGQTRQTLVGAGVVAVGIPASAIVLRRRRPTTPS